MERKTKMMNKRDGGSYELIETKLGLALFEFSWF